MSEYTATNDKEVESNKTGNFLSLVKVSSVEIEIDKHTCNMY